MDVLRALAGSESAARVIAQQGARRYHDKLHELDEEISEHYRQTWDREAQREWALDAETEVDAEEFRAVWDAINDRMLKLLVGSVTLIFGDPEASQAIEPELRETLFELFLLAANPETRYNVVAGFRPELRPMAADALEEFGRETWGSLLALTADEVDPAEFPEATRYNIEALAEQRRAYLEQQGGVGGEAGDD